jgi:cell division septum initiation protein DivIVA
MQKKLQVFISSTFIDLQEERQIAVESVLNAGHIPAGMELFKSGDKTQKEVIKKWIDESDVYMLILGGCYGSIDDETGMSYTHWEYEYAGEIGKPRFAVVINDDTLEEKVKKLGLKVTERKNVKQYQEFKELVLSKMSKFYSDLKDIKITVLESLKEFEKDKSLSGWISGKDIEESNNFEKENYQLLKENSELKKQIEKLEIKLKKENDIGGTSFEEIVKVLKSKKATFPSDYEYKKFAGKTFSVLQLYLLFQEDFAIGIDNQYGMSNLEKVLFFTIAPHLLTYGLVEKVKVVKNIQRIQTSKDGLIFIRLANSKLDKEKTVKSNLEQQEKVESPPVKPKKKATVKKVTPRKASPKKNND